MKLTKVNNRGYHIPEDLKRHVVFYVRAFFARTRVERGHVIL